MIINELALAQAIISEGSALGIQNARSQPERPISLSPSGHLTLNFCRLVHTSEPLYGSVYSWLLADPRTTVTPDFLSITTTLERPDYTVKLEVCAPIISSDRELLRAIGKIVTVPYDYTTLVC